MMLNKFKEALGQLAQNLNLSRPDKTPGLLDDVKTLIKSVNHPDQLDNNFFSLLDSLYEQWPTDFKYTIMDAMDIYSYTKAKNPLSDKIVNYILNKDIKPSILPQILKRIMNRNTTNFYPQMLEKYKPDLETKLVWIKECVYSKNWDMLEEQIQDLLVNHPSNLADVYVLSTINDCILGQLAEDLDSAASLEENITNPGHISREEKYHQLGRFLSLHEKLINKIIEKKSFTFTFKEKKIIKNFKKITDSNINLLDRFGDLSLYTNSRLAPVLAKYNFKTFEEKFLKDEEEFALFLDESCTHDKILFAISPRATPQEFIKILNAYDADSYWIPSCMSTALRHLNYELVEFLNLNNHHSLQEISALYPSLNAIGLDNIAMYKTSEIDWYSVINTLPAAQFEKFLEIFNPHPEQLQSLLNSSIESRSLINYELISARGVDYKKIDGKIVFKLIKEVSDDYNSPQTLAILKDIFVKEGNPSFYLECAQKGVFKLTQELTDFLNIQREKQSLSASIISLAPAISQKIAKI